MILAWASPFKGAVTLYVNAGYKLRFLLCPYNVTRRIYNRFIYTSCYNIRLYIIIVDVFLRGEQSMAIA